MSLYEYLYVYTYACIYAVTDLISMYIHILTIPLHLNFLVIHGELWKTQLWVVGTVAKGAFAKMWSNPWWKHGTFSLGKHYCDCCDSFDCFVVLLLWLLWLSWLLLLLWLLLLSFFLGCPLFGRIMLVDIIPWWLCYGHVICMCIYTYVYRNCFFLHVGSSIN